MDLRTFFFPLSPFRLVQYPLDDVVFSPEGPADTWCGVETRRCQDCSTPVDDESFGEPWNWCGTRTMTMRLATRLHRMAVLTNGQSIRYCYLTKFLIMFYIIHFLAGLVYLYLIDVYMPEKAKISHLSNRGVSLKETYIQIKYYKHKRL